MVRCTIKRTSKGQPAGHLGRRALIGKEFAQSASKRVSKIRSLSNTVYRHATRSRHSPGDAYSFRSLELPVRICAPATAVLLRSFALRVEELQIDLSPANRIQYGQDQGGPEEISRELAKSGNREIGRQRINRSRKATLVFHSHTSRQSALEVVEECRCCKGGRQVQGYD
jgi:hypothetical protein